MRGSMPKAVHLISSDVPYPADYGGMIDVFYTIRQLAQAGIEVYLHCFQYGREEAPELKQYCKEVHYYKRKTGLTGLSLSLPYMMYSRRDARLLPNLLRIDAPIIFEGIHCCYLLNEPSLAGRKKILRNQNVEQQYYALLADRTDNPLKKLYFRAEAALLRRFENKLQAADFLAPISQKDTEFFKILYPAKPVVYVAGFHPFDKLLSQPGQGTYCLYQGNLGHPENIEVTLFLVNEVFSTIDTPLVVAGRNPHPRIIAACIPHPHIRLIANPSEDEMQGLIAAAQVHVLPTFQASGLKLKLLYALYSGRFVLVNQAMLYGTGLDAICEQAETPVQFADKIRHLMQRPFLQEDIDQRATTLSRIYDNTTKVDTLISLINS